MIQTGIYEMSTPVSRNKFSVMGFSKLYLHMYLYIIIHALQVTLLLTHFLQTWHTNAFLQRLGVRWPNESINIYPLFGSLKFRVLGPKRALLAKIPLYTSIMTQ